MAEKKKPSTPVSSKPEESKDSKIEESKDAGPSKTGKEVTKEQVQLALHVDMGGIVGDRWTVSVKLGQGAFGAVYKVKDMTGEHQGEMALKLESTLARSQVLKVEVAVLKSMQGCKHTCELFSRGRNDSFNFMVMSLLGSCLADLRRKQKGSKFSPSTSVRITLQSVEAVREMHKCNWIHRDVKPANFCMGAHAETANKVYIFDFGLARRFARDSGMRPLRNKVGFRGTRRYCSINAHYRKELGRQDDLVSVLYMIAEFSSGKLPWASKKENSEIRKAKQTSGTTIYKDLPDGIAKLHEKLYKLKYEDEPEYQEIESTFKAMIDAKKWDKQPFDWNITGTIRETPNAKDIGEDSLLDKQELKAEVKPQIIEEEVEELPVVPNKQ